MIATLFFRRIFSTTYVLVDNIILLARECIQLHACVQIFKRRLFDVWYRSLHFDASMLACE